MRRSRHPRGLLVPQQREAIASVAAGDNVTLEASSWNATSGAHTARGEADAFGTVAEQDETNNAAELAFVTRQADLVVVDILYPTVPLHASPIDFRAVVKNQGDAGAVEKVFVRFVVDDRDLGSTVIERLDAGQEIEVQAPTSWVAQRGLHTIHVTMDHVERVNESDETNNDRSEQFTVV